MDGLEAAYRDALALHRGGKSVEAERVCLQLIQQDPNCAKAINLFTWIRFVRNQSKRERLQRIIQICDKAIALQPASGKNYMRRAKVSSALGAYEEALKYLDKGLSLRSDFPDLYSSRGDVLVELTRHEDAIASYHKAIELRPNFYLALFGLAKTLHKLGRLNEALEAYNKAVSANPNCAKVYVNRGNCLFDLNQLTEALAAYDKAARLEPDLAATYNCRGNVLSALNRHGEALRDYNTAIALKPQDQAVHLNKGLLLLLLGEFKLGWREYEWRKHDPKHSSRKALAQPEWSGTDRISGKTILVHWEQGFGDTIQFARYISVLNKAGAKVLFAPQRPLKALMGGLAGDFQCVDLANPELEYDYHCPLLSLPFAFQTGLDTICKAVPYIDIDPRRVQPWAEKLGSQGFKIGICWQGSDAGRSFPVAHFANIASLPNVRLICLHKGDGLSQLESLPAAMKVETFDTAFDSGLDAFMDTAAVMKVCDLIITSDTAVAHLAGALGVPTWVALQQVPNWRWMLDRPDSPWYPTMRLFRQRRRDDWASVFEEIAHALIKEMRCRNG